MLKDPDVIFIGGGPVGLWTAIQLKLLQPSLKIQIFEKYEEYQRHHNLHVEHSSLTGTHPDAKFQTLIASFPGFIETSRIETALLNFAKELGIGFDIGFIEDCQALKAEFPSAKFIIGSDGRQSVIRKQIFGDDLDYSFNLKCIVEVKYKVSGKTKPLDWQSGFRTLARCDHLLVEQVGRERDGETSVALRIFIDQATFDAIEGATFKNPMPINIEFAIKFPALYNTVTTWLEARKHYTNEQPLEPMHSITKVPLDIYQSKKVVMTDESGVYWLLVGDSAFGLPFFRALNDGLLSGTHLARYIYGQLSKECSIDEYEAYFGRLTLYEKWLAQIKSIVLDTGITSVRGSQVSYGAMEDTAATSTGGLSWLWGMFSSAAPSSLAKQNEGEGYITPGPKKNQI
jgi:hypothetical protein